MRTLRIIIIAVFLAAILVISTHANVPGGKGHMTNMYRGSVSVGKGSIKFKVELDPISFLLNRVNNKYKLVRITVDGGVRRVKLSTKDDRIEFFFNNRQKPIPGILDLRKDDSKYWKSLDKKVRDVLAYPMSIGQERIKGAVICVYLLASEVEALSKPDRELEILPESIKYTIAALPGKDIKINRVYIGTAK